MSGISSTSALGFLSPSLSLSLSLYDPLCIFTYIHAHTHTYIYIYSFTWLPFQAVPLFHAQEALFLSRLWTSLLLQTPWFSTFLRLLGARVGARVCFDDDLGFHEPWLLEIGDDSQFGVARLSPHSMEPWTARGSRTWNAHGMQLIISSLRNWTAPSFCNAW